jgi:hypothetical protein
MQQRKIGIRWTIGDVAPPGFVALRLSIWGAFHIFGPDARLVVCVNSIPIEEARRRTGDLPEGVDWRGPEPLPSELQAMLTGSMAEGVAWKLAPPRLFPDAYEISLDNDCILWALPNAMNSWLTEDDPPCLIAADVQPAFGSFAPFTRAEPRNTGIRGFPPGYNLEEALVRVLQEHPVRLDSELDEQGLQAVATERERPPRIVPTEDVTICSPIWPHQPWLGRCGAHFVGLNTRHLSFDYYGKPARELVLANWEHMLPELKRRVGVAEFA